MQLVAEEADLQAGYVQFQTKQTEQLLTTLQHGDKFAKVRALNNLKQIGVGVVNTPSSITAKVGANTELQSELAANASVAQQAQREATEQEKAPEQAQMRSNRDQLSTAFQRQNLKGAQERGQ